MFEVFKTSMGLKPTLSKENNKLYFGTISIIKQQCYDLYVGRCYYKLLF